MLDWMSSRVPVLVGAALVLAAAGGTATMTASLARQDLLAAHAESYAAIVNAVVASGSDQTLEYVLGKSAGPFQLPSESMGKSLQAIYHVEEVIVLRDGKAARFPIFGHADPGGAPRFHLWYEPDADPALRAVLDDQIRELVVDPTRPLIVRAQDAHVYLTQR